MIADFFKIVYNYVENMCITHKFFLFRIINLGMNIVFLILNGYIRCGRNHVKIDHF